MKYRVSAVRTNDTLATVGWSEDPADATGIAVSYADWLVRLKNVMAKRVVVQDTSATNDPVVAQVAIPTASKLAL